MFFNKSYSLNTKITLSFLTLGFIFLSILFIQIIPNLQEEQEQYKKREIGHMVSLTKEQLKLAVELLTHSSVSRRNEINALLKNLLEKNILKDTLEENIIDIKALKEESKCDVFYLDEKQTIQDDILKLLNSDGIKAYYGEQNHMCPKIIKKLYYLKTFKNNRKIVLECEPKLFKNKHINLEENIKKDLEKSFDLTYQDHKGKINLMWLNTKHKDFETMPLYNISDQFYNEKYCLSKMSSAPIPQTGKLSGKQILDATEKEAIIHFLKDTSLKEKEQIEEKAITWIRTIKDQGDVKILFLTTIFEKDFNRDFYSPIVKVLPAAFLAFFVAVILGFFVFKRLFKSINILTNTASEVNKGNITLRSKISGTDDIAILGRTFDNMLDSIEENINNLDKKVEEKTKELSSSLEEKEVLLKEIHHRVKNNLAMTINLIKLQKSKIEDEKTKDILVDIQERIFTMELLHRKLYESKDLNSIPFKKYVEELCSDLNKTYSNSRNIKITCDIEDININIEYALPCGIIITESLTNVYKYAFEGNSGEISISFKKDKNKCRLIIKDNGKGLPKDIDINKTKSLGLRLVSSITKGQLHGDFEYKYEKGSSFIINFSYI